MSRLMPRGTPEQQNTQQNTQQYSTTAVKQTQRGSIRGCCCSDLAALWMHSQSPLLCGGLELAWAAGLGTGACTAAPPPSDLSEKPGCLLAAAACEFCTPACQWPSAYSPHDWAESRPCSGGAEEAPGGRWGGRGKASNGQVSGSVYYCKGAGGKGTCCTRMGGQQHSVSEVSFSHDSKSLHAGRLLLHAETCCDDA